jgi:O-antigen ligase
MGLRHPVAGGGLNAFQALGHGVYPHNVFLEAFAEGGILGVTVLVLFLARPLWLLGARRDDVLVPLACFAVVLLSSQFSGNFFDTRGVFLLAAFLTMTEGRPSPGAAPPGALREGPGRPDEAPAP